MDMQPVFFEKEYQWCFHTRYVRQKRFLSDPNVLLHENKKLNEVILEAGYKILINAGIFECWIHKVKLSDLEDADFSQEQLRRLKVILKYSMRKIYFQFWGMWDFLYNYYGWNDLTRKPSRKK